MRIAYTTTYDPSQISSWSGLGYYIAWALQNAGFRIDYIGPLKADGRQMFRLKEIFYGKILLKKYLRERESYLVRAYASQVSRALSDLKSDIIFSPGTLPVAYLETEKPIVLWADATFAGLADFYPGFANLCRETKKNGNKIEQAALSKCRLAIYSSEWAAKTAIENYEIDPKKVKCVPFGANISPPSEPRDIERLFKLKDFDTCRLLFIGVDWHRKNGELAVNVAKMMNKNGIKTELHIVGCHPPIEVPDYVVVHGFISKMNDAGDLILKNLFESSHFFILPSKAECFGVVFAEASSFGLPSLATDVGGIKSAVKDGCNGRIFRLEDPAEKYCEYIEQVLSSPDQYFQLMQSSFNYYTEALNWDSAGKTVAGLINEFCN